MPRSRLLPGLLASLILFVAATDGQAVICTVLNSPKRFVGDTGAPGNQCTDNDIQSAIDAIKNGTNTCPATIYITHDHTYTSQHLVFDNTNRIITLVGLDGGVPCGSTNPQICDPTLGCPPPPTVPLNTIDGSNTAGSVIHLNGTNTVTVRYLTIKGGATALGDAGGGVFFSGIGSLTLDTVTVSDNSAGYGGGIYLNGNGGDALLTLDANTLIVNNSAQYSGGGIRIDGSAKLSAQAPQTLIALNGAGSDGGGLSVLGPARADIGSGGYNGLGVVFSNQAPRGGGISVFGGENTSLGEPGVVSLFTTDPSSPVRVQGNFAAIAGGAAYTKGHVDIGGNYNDAYLCASAFRIDENGAPDGAAVYVDWDSAIGVDQGGGLALNSDVFSSGVNLCSHGTSCAAGVPCNLISKNVSEDSLAQPTDGATILIGNASVLKADAAEFRNNTAGHTIQFVGSRLDFQKSFLSNSVLADNATTLDLLDFNAAPFTIDSCTIAGNTIGGTLVYHDVTTLRNSLIFQTGKIVGFVNDAASAQYILSSSINVLPSDPTIQLLTDPKFVDAAHGDYHLLLASPAVDYAGGSGGNDLDGYPRDVDLATKANTFGPRDVGAYERQSPFACDNAPDAVYCSTFDP